MGEAKRREELNNKRLEYGLSPIKNNCTTKYHRKIKNGRVLMVKSYDTVKPEIRKTWQNTK